MRCLVPLLCLFLSACAGSNLSRPKVPAVFNTISLYTDADFQKDVTAYKSAVVACAKPSALEACTAKNLRDSIINRIKFDIDLNYYEYKSQLYFGRGGLNVGLDALELGLATGATLAGAAGSKTVLAAILSGVKGTRLSFDKNFFQERTIPIILARIETLRDEVANQISQKMSLPVAQYPLEEGWGDLVELFYAGTLQAGIQALAADTGQGLREMNARKATRLQQRMK